MPYDDEPLPLNNTEDIDKWIEQALRARWPLPDDQRDQPDPRLIQELDEYYTEQARAINHRLGRVWQRLEQHTGMRPPRRRQERSASRRPFPSERRQPLEKRGSLVFAEWRWPERLSALVAAVLLIVLAGGLIAGLVLVQHPGSQTIQPVATATATITKTSTPAVTPTPDASIVPIFINFTMLDAQHGWALDAPEQVKQTPNGTTISQTNEYNVLTTSSGGAHWQDVTPPVRRGTPVTLDFVTASLAWVFAAPNKLYVTTDGGHTWQQASTPVNSQYSQLLRFTFLNAQDGWSILATGGQAGSIALFQTTDGGQSWVKQQSTDAQGNTPSGALPLKHINWLTFTDPSTGWATGDNAGSDGFVSLYVTHDGGTTWQLQRLPLPSQGFSGPTVDTRAPAFFNAQDGILDVASTTTTFQPQAVHPTPSGGLGRVIYVTHDGGATWQSGALLPDAEGSVSFSDADHGWLASSTNLNLWSTSDGGRTWTQLPSRSLSAYAGGGGSYSSIDFVSAQIGWAEQTDSVHGTLLFKTEDGGHSWTQITLSISS